MSRFDAWDEVINRVNSRLASWKSRLLSIGGRLTLTNRALGGLGVGSLRAKNLALLAKWQWRFLNEKDGVWNKVISSFYGPQGGFSSVSGLRLRKGVWQNILNIGGAIDALGISFRQSFKRKSCFLQDRWVSLDGEWRANWEWRIQPRGRTEGDITNLENILNGLALKMDDNDGWIWSLDNNKGFSVNHLSKLIDSRILSPGCLGRVVNWINWVPRKVNIFNWRVVNDRIPHLSNLDKRGIDVHSLLCPLFSAHPPSFVSLVSSFFSHNKKWLAKICHGVSLVVLWAIWRWQNRIIHTVSDSRQAVIDVYFPKFTFCRFCRSPTGVNVLALIGPIGFHVHGRLSKAACRSP
ncbi:hypothetical protein CTI12_AA061190 [Artemisia annua]|uniref:Reverse transcriptase zinc-binding domain-containing protein n=1 Tax=Artemisia annua TaxID=35608 RepID=A0A2U1Q8C2_ARTAN|nr:hypothetical protein CTI12_AA061190 [Artemisia annua]